MSKALRKIHRSTQYARLPIAELLAYQKAFSPEALFEIALRYMAIESYDNDSQGSALYRKALVSRGLDAEEHMRSLKALIESVEKEGFDGRTAIVLDSSLRITDGFNRVALALYIGVKEIRCLIKGGKRKAPDKAPWFAGQGLTLEETSLVARKGGELYRESKQVLAFILWAPASKFFDNITADISLLYDLVEVRDCEIEAESFPQTLKALYNVGPEEEWKIESKVKGLEKYPKRLRLLVVDINAASFHPRAWRGKRVFPEATLAKTSVRRKYKRHVPGYFYDCIIHATDGWEDTVRVMSLLAPDFPVDSL